MSCKGRTPCTGCAGCREKHARFMRMMQRHPLALTIPREQRGAGKATRQQVLETARSYIGTRFRHLGRTRDGLDCFGLIIRVAWDLRLSTFIYDGYGRLPHPPSVRAHCDAQMIGKPLTQALPGDVFLMAEQQWECHLAFLGEQYGKATLIHSFAGMRGVVEIGLTDTLRSHIRACYQLPNLTEEGSPWLN